MYCPDILAVRCSRCGSIDLLDEPLPSSATDADVDAYVEVGGGVGTIAEFLTLVDHRRVRRFLDVGCGYGFSLDLGRELFGWEVTGIEPSLAGLRGAAELDVDIRHEFLTETSDVGTDFDLVLSSEVLEHVTDPIGFLTVIRQRLAPGGSLVLTTPVAEILSPDEPVAEVLSALSSGYHVFLASQQGLGIALDRAGFPHHTITRARGNFRVVASLAPIGETKPSPVSPQQLQDYFAGAADRAAPDTPLALGMATRFLRQAVARGDFDSAERAVPGVVAAFTGRYGLSLDDPFAPASGFSASAPPWSLPGAAFAMGMLELLHRDDPERAAAFFLLARDTARRWLSVVETPDLDTVDIRYQSEYHRLIALARFDAAQAASGALELRAALDESARDADLTVRVAQARIFIETVARGADAASGALASTIAADTAELASSPDAAVRAAGLDGMYSLGIAAIRSGDAGTGLSWLQRCRSECSALGPGDTHAVQLAGLCDSALSSFRVAGVTTESAPRSHYMIDLYWADASGTFLQGWMHAEDLAVQSISVRSNGPSVTAERQEREDLLHFWPGMPEVVHGGFRVYLPGVPGPTVTITAHTARGPIHQVARLPNHQLPDVQDGERLSDIEAQVAAFIAHAPPGPVLALGVRATTPEGALKLREQFGRREVIGVDIHPGPGVDVVGDVHELSTLFPRNHFSIVYSSSVLEHVAAPWLVAAQCALVTREGGLNIHQSPWLWPTHAAPNDFWRMSTGGLAQLFSAELGFAVRWSSEFGAATMFPHGQWRAEALNMPTLSSGAGAQIVVEKVNDAASSVTWPYSTDIGGRIAREYPVDGLPD